jgi:fatty-acyl-CoA synthase
MRSTMQAEQLTVTDILRHGATWNSRSLVRSSRPDGSIETVGFGQVAVLAEKLAHGLASLGVRPGDRVGSYMWNQVEHLAAYFAVPAMGAILHTANIRLSSAQNTYCVTIAGDRVLLVDADLLPALEPQWGDLPTVETVVVNGPADLSRIEARGKRAVGLADLLDAAPAGYDWPDLDEYDAASICFTTGTTGNPKGVAYSHRSIWLHSLATSAANGLRLGADDRAVIAVPMFHACAWGYPYTAFWTGADMVLPNRFVSPAHLVDVIERYALTFANGVPTVWRDVLRYLEANPGHDISSLRRLVVGGAAAPATLIEEFDRRHGVHVLQGWGMTETSPLVTAAWPPRDAAEPERARYRATQGRVLPGVRIRLTDVETGAVLPADGTAIGELELRGPWIAAGYLNDDEPGKFRDGWLRTGDVGTLDPRGYVQLSDRAKDVIKSGGEWISSVALESLIVGHPTVADAAVIGVPDTRWDERPLALVVVRDGAEADADELRSWLADRVQKWWLPERWAFVPELPRTSVGKTDKKLIRQRYADGAFQVVTVGTQAASRR